VNKTEVLYIVFQKRLVDKQAWPILYTDKALAEACYCRCSEVVEVVMSFDEDNIQNTGTKRI